MQYKMGIVNKQNGRHLIGQIAMTTLKIGKISL
jgi:hypothetical protein